MTSAPSQENPSSGFDIPRHTKFWLRCSSLLPTEYTAGDANRMSLGFFIVSALDLLGLLDPSHPKAISEKEKQGWVEWIYSLQLPEGGFRGFKGGDFGAKRSLWNKGWDGGSLANGFLALVTLVVLGDDLGRARKMELAKWVRGLQRVNGGFAEHMPSQGGSGGDEVARDDMRMCYCAAGIAFILGNEYECVDNERLRRFVVNAQAYEGGLGQSWGLEGHSGLNFCALACLELVRRLEGLDRHDPAGKFEVKGLDGEECVRYVLMRQTTWVDDEDDEDEDEDEEHHEKQEQEMEQRAKNGNAANDDSLPMAGFNGRTNKMADTCYCYWNMGALDILGVAYYANRESVRRYLYEKTQHRIGGFSKAPGEHPDLMHSYLGLAALAIMQEKGVKQLDAVLCASSDVRRRIEELPWRRGEESVR